MRVVMGNKESTLPGFAVMLSARSQLILCLLPDCFVREY